MKTTKSNVANTTLPVLALIVLILLTGRVFGQEGGSPKGGSPYFFVISSDPKTDQLPLKSTRADVSITGVIADVAVTQEYKNEGRTAYTSFIAVEEQQVNTEKELTTVKQALPLPLHVENSAVGFEVEIEEDAVSFSFHKKIVLPADLDRITSGKIQTSIEKKLMPAINAYLISHNVALDLIEVVVGMDGGVVKVQIAGKNLTKEQQSALTKIIAKHAYTKYSIYSVWKFKIVF
jgi:hypothetical protein